MKKTRNIIIAALVCFLAAGLSIPVIASNLWEREAEISVTRVEKDIPAKSAVSVKTLAEVSAQKQETESEAVSNDVQDQCPYYADENGDGICDHCVNADVQGNVQNQCANYMDANGDGVCDHCVNGSGNAQNRCANYVDENGDGACDHCVNGSAQNQGSGNGYGHHGGGHHAERRGHHGR